MGQSVLTAAMAAHFEGFPGLYAASVGEANVPEVTKVVAAHVEPGTDVVRFVVARRFGQRFVEAVARHPRATLVAAKVMDYTTFQFKGRVLESFAATPDDEALAAAHADGFCALVAAIGVDVTRFRPSFTGGPYTTVRLEVDAVFDQTPRVGAGALVSQAGVAS